jgi:predicted lipoprotein
MIRKKHVHTFFFAILAIVFMSTTCNTDPDPADHPDFDRKTLLANLGDNVIMPAYLDLETKVIVMDDAVNVFVADRTFANMDAMRDAWKAALLSWQHVSMFNFGPAETQALVSAVNIYPADTAQMFANFSTGSYDLATASNVDAKGFQAIDYLIYGIGADDNETILLFEASSAGTLRQYLIDVSADIRTHVVATVNGWKASSGNYIGTFKSSDGTDVGSSLGLMLNAFTQHFEVHLRDGKIGIPAGARTFTATPLPEKVEGYFHAASSVEFAYESMLSFNNVYLGIEPDGHDGAGFDDYLQFLEAKYNTGSLNDAIVSQTSVALNSISNLSDPLSAEVVNNQQLVMTSYSEMQQLIVLYKVDMMSALGILVTYVDNDGD